MELNEAQQAHYDRFVAEQKWKDDERKSDHRLKRKGGLGNVEDRKSTRLNSSH